MMSDFEPLALQSDAAVLVRDAFDLANCGYRSTAAFVAREILKDKRYEVLCWPWARDFLAELDEQYRRDPTGFWLDQGDIPYPQYYRPDRAAYLHGMMTALLAA